jgi:tetratricopeptide (TPR) repeat protein
LLALGALGALAGCRGSARPAAPPPPHGNPLTPRELPTTDGAIALSNLAGQIAKLEIGVEEGRESPTALVELLVLRGQVLGRIDEYEKADRVASRAVAKDPRDPRAYLARAKSGMAFHRFLEVRRDLDEAERQGAEPAAIETGRAAVLQATGEFDLALEIRKRQSATQPGILTLGAQASLLAERGDVDDAERFFVEAIRAYRDVSPFPVSWIDFQEGMMWMRAGDLERARDFFAAVLERLPRHAPAAANLGWFEAALGHRERAIALLRGVAATSDDPEAAGLLAQVLQYAGQGAEAARFRGLAAARYDDLVGRHPEAFADHAARFWLGPGADPHKAWALARRNLANRKTPAAYVLLVQAALAIGDREGACQAARAAVAFGHPPPAPRPLAERAVAERALIGC